MACSNICKRNCEGAARRPCGARGLKRWPRGWSKVSTSRKHRAQRSKSSQSAQWKTRPTSGGPAWQPSHVTWGWTSPSSSSSSSPSPGPPSSAAAAAAARARRRAAAPLAPGALAPPAPRCLRRPCAIDGGCGPGEERSGRETAACRVAVNCSSPSSWRWSSVSSRTRARSSPLASSSGSSSSPSTSSSPSKGISSKSSSSSCSIELVSGKRGLSLEGCPVPR
mmetsp:Transcript_95385/g.239036  ORF Transcript_95385/g.239036 Transcript_95385/m.239036 type:complete len:223 (+) Transcript_95385:511-1179(+)